jgi:AraC-like DNA-binding protein
MGMTPMQYATSWRMEIVKKRLAGNKSSLSDAAEAAGYASDAAFTRVFKKETGMTPAGFRKIMTAQDGPSTQRSAVR